VPLKKIPVSTSLDDDRRLMSIRSVIETALQIFGLEQAVLLRETDTGAQDVLHASDVGFENTQWNQVTGLLGDTHWVANIPTSPFADRLPLSALHYQAMFCVPVQFSQSERFLVVLFASRAEHFPESDRVTISWMFKTLTHSADSPNDAPPGPEMAAPAVVINGLMQSLQRLASWQNCIADSNQTLLAAPSEALDPAITQTLGEIGRLTGSDRTCVFLFRSDVQLKKTHEWIAPGAASAPDQLRELPTGAIDGMRDELVCGRPVYIADVNTLPSTSAVLPIMLMKGLRSLLATPILHVDTLIGCIFFCSATPRPLFHQTEVRLLMSFSNAMGAAISRRNAEQQLLRTQARLVHQRNRLSATLAALPDLVLEQDRDGRYVGFHAGRGAKLAYSPDVFLNRLPSEILPPDLVDASMKALRDAEAGEQDDGPREYMLTIEGQPCWFSSSVGVKRDGSDIVGFVSILRDVTAQRENARAIRKLSKIVSLTSNLVIITDPKGRIEWVNSAFEKRSGWKIDEVIGQTLWEFLPAPTTDASTIDRLIQARRARRPAQAEVLQQSRTGEEYWISTDVQPLFDSSGNLEGFVSVQTDITPLKRRFEEKLLLQSAAIEASNDAITISSADGRYIFMNLAHRRMFGIPDDAPAETFVWGDMLPPEMLSRMKQEVREHLITERTWRGEIKARHSNGSQFDLEISLTITDGGEFVSIGRDITHRKRNEADRVKLREALEVAQKREALASVASGIAHDLNNLVAIISGTVGMMLSQHDLDDSTHGNLNRMNRAVDAAHELVFRLGRLGRAEAPRQLQDLRLIAMDAIELLGPERLKAYAIHADLPPDAQPVDVNHTEMLQVIMNLALNACEAAGTDTNKVTLVIHDEGAAIPSRRPDIGAYTHTMAYALLSVSDTGIGVPDELRPKLFDRYMTTKGASGTGLGLHIVASIIREYNGALWFDSVEGKGSTVTVAIPRASIARQDGLSFAPVSALPTRLDGHNIIVVDDNMDVAEVISLMLDKEGAISVAISDPMDAHQLILSEPDLWSAVVTDFDMPGMNGAQLALAVSKVAPQLPFILVTALPESSGWDRTLFHSIHAKPLQRDMFLRSVANAVMKPKSGG
jgi:PAS domain S-box-containing protein